jgi:hypothetical protein
VLAAEGATPPVATTTTELGRPVFTHAINALARTVLVSVDDKPVHDLPPRLSSPEIQGGNERGPRPTQGNCRNRMNPVEPWRSAPACSINTGAGLQLDLTGPVKEAALE